MNQKIKTIVGIIAVLLLVFFAMISVTHAQAPYGDNLRAAMLYDTGTTTPGVNNASYYPTDKMETFLKIDTYNMNQNIDRPVTIKIQAPKQYLDTTRSYFPEFPWDRMNPGTPADQQNRYTITKTVEATHLVFTITFDRWYKEDFLQLPVFFKFIPKIVPSNYVLPVTAELIDGDQILPSNQLGLKVQYKPQKGMKHLNTNMIRMTDDPTDSGKWLAFQGVTQSSSTPPLFVDKQ